MILILMMWALVVIDRLLWLYSILRTKRKKWSLLLTSQSTPDLTGRRCRSKSEADETKRYDDRPEDRLARLCSIFILEYQMCSDVLTSYTHTRIHSTCHCQNPIDLVSSHVMSHQQHQNGKERRTSTNPTTRW